MLRNLSSRRRQLLASAGAAVGALALAGAAAGLATNATAATGAPAAAPAASGNLLTNPGFETGDLSGWTCDAGTGAVVASPVRSGTHSLAGTPSGSADAQCTQTVSVQPNTAYTFSGYVEGSYVYIGVTGGTSTWTPSATSWQQLSVAFTTTASQTSVQVYVHGWYGQPVYHADDLALTGPAGPPPTTPPTTPTTPPTTPSTTPTTVPTSSTPTTPTSSTPSTPPSSSSSAPGGTTCPVKSRPAGKVIQGYWENWDGALNGVHPGLGWIPINDPRIQQHGYNVINAAFPVILSDGTAEWQDGMDTNVKVDTPADYCAAKASGATILMSIGGAAAGIDLNSSTVADKFVATIVPILKAYNFDGIDIDIETGLTGSGSINTLSTSQANLERIIDGILAQMPSNFGLTMAPETAYVTGGSVTYGSIWGSYLPIIKKYMDNGRLWWLNMQYYNGSMYGCSGDSYQAATVQGFQVQTNCLNSGLTIQGTTIKVPYDHQVPGLPAQPGAGGGYMTPSLVSQAWSSVGGQVKGLMTWSVNWDGSLGWTFGNNVKGLEGR
ncbi:Carbohydrate-binding CenC domain protein [Catenulispora acidiphila DSM 44928]|uniref:chitinase n=1 Tax=Catenulispora acidiphila (strain DSM 44928 / JCM 14897 / NBRC 102108 / NRRL B-24433 / ID139908) TaxID=479433 RepID=C7QI44_CATAD|nr:glycosyl hydrolase family 18 protein [Catenulispora acidiphila]ACU73089.1 Carbohydrate-binding CenC domain protein [Catenulispora acidiphila DSM 44928]